MKLALRSLTRSPTRSILSVLGVAIGCALALIDLSMIRAEIALYRRYVAEGGVGHFRIAPQGWLQSHDSNLRLTNWQAEWALAKSDPRVLAATPRARVQAMLAMGTRMAGTEIVGVDPRFEPFAYRYVRTMAAGRYLQPGDTHQVVIGQAIADRLKVGVGDELVVTVSSASGELKNDMFSVLGIVRLGSKELESTLCQMTLSDLEALSGISGAGEIAVILKNPSDLPSILRTLRPQIPAADTLLSWDEILPEARFAVVVHEISGRLLTFILLFVAFVGVASAQLTAILERRKEFAILSAIGMGRKRILTLIFGEAFVLGTLAWVVSLVLATPLVYYWSTAGIRLLRESESLSVIGALIDPIFYVDFGPWLLAYAAFLSYAAMLAASLYPAYLTLRLNPLEALRVAQ